MILSIFQLNIHSDNHWDNLVSFLKSNSFDILLFQEITGLGTICGTINSKRDCFRDLSMLLEAGYCGELAISNGFTSGPDAYIGNAVFYNKKFTLINKKTIILNSLESPFPSDSISFENTGHNILHLDLSVNNKLLSVLTTHGAWAKTSEEHPHQTEQGEKLLAYLKNISTPFIFTGDLNLNPAQPLIQKISELARNLITENNIPNTLNPRLHRSGNLFPGGVAVDYIFVSQDLKLIDFEVVENDISDHFGLIAKIEI